MNERVYAMCPECFCHVTLVTGKTVTAEPMKQDDGTIILLSFVCSSCGVEINLDEAEESVVMDL